MINFMYFHTNYIDFLLHAFIDIDANIAHVVKVIEYFE